MREVGAGLFEALIVPLLLAVVGVVWLSRKPRTRGHLASGCSDRVACSSIVAALSLSAAAFLLVRFNDAESRLGELDFYWTRALNLATNGVFGYGSRPTAFFPPGYSFLLTPAALVLGDTPWGWFLTNACVLVASAALLRWQLTQLAIPGPLANVAAVVLVASPNRLAALQLPLSDVPFSLAFVLVLGFLLLSAKHPERAGYLVAAALLAGTSVLIRVSGAIILVPVGLWLVARPSGSLWRRLRRAALFAALSLLVVAPWTMRNWLLLGAFVPVSTNGGYNLLIGNNPEARGGWNTGADLAAASVRGLNEAQQDAVLAAQARRQIGDQPWLFLRMGLWKVTRSFATDAYAFIALWRNTNAGDLPGWATASVFAISNFVYYVTAIAAVVVFLRRLHLEPDAGALLVATLVGVSVALFVFVGMTRYKEPTTTVLLLFLAVHAGSLGPVRETQAQATAHD